MKGEFKDTLEKSLVFYPENEEEERKLRELFLKNRIFILSFKAYIKDDLKLGVTKFDRLIIKLEAKDKWEEFRERIKKCKESKRLK